MSITKEETKKLIKKHGSNENDSGSTASQISILTERINNITLHLKENKKDHSARRGLVLMVSKRKKLLKYLIRKKVDSYVNIIKELDIRG